MLYKAHRGYITEKPTTTKGVGQLLLMRQCVEMQETSKKAQHYKTAGLGQALYLSVHPVACPTLQVILQQRSRAVQKGC